MIDIILAVIIGSILGIFTGIIPGIHVNLLAVIIIALSPLYANLLSPIVIAVFILSIAVSHTFCKAIPATFIGVAEEDTIFNLLPSHQMLMQGKGYEAVKLTIIGSILGALIIVLVSPLLIIYTETFYNLIKTAIPYLLIISSLFLIYKEKNKAWALAIFIISGIFGILTFNVPNIKEVLLPLLSGLFGLSALLLSLKDQIKIPKQIINKDKIKDLLLTKSIGLGILASILVGFLPGLGSAQSAALATSISKKNSTKSTLVILGSIDTIIMILSIIAFYTIERARSGAVVAISRIVPTFSISQIILFMGIILISSGICSIITLYLTRFIANKIYKINYKKIVIIVSLFIIALVAVISGPLGLFILTISTIIGTLPIFLKVSRSQLMGCLIIPVIIYLI
ncbi:tripartite tricarboxylate transporter permease [Candidatus Woesearchaeota archaeon]|nr:tripartite tricarboxylate transporter permease [Candidatus Woesearchaeota archaeon]